MRQIIRQREIVADGWSYPLAPGMRATGTAPQVVEGDDPALKVLSFAEFLERAPGAAPGSLAVWVEPADEIEKIGPMVDRARLVVIHFPKSGEGRGFSQAQLLRQRYRYAGELRAAGALGRDQLFFLSRCGCDAFDLDPTEDLNAALAAFHTFTVAYQPGPDPQGTLPGRRF